MDVGHWATYPPSMGSRTPVTLTASSEHRKTAASAQSSAVMGRPSGWLAPRCSHLPRSSARPPSPGGHEAGVGHAGRADGVHPDPERRHLDGDCPGQLVHAALGGAVDRAAPTDEAGHRSGVQDHSAVTLLLEPEDGVLGAQEHATQIDGDQALEVLEVWSSKTMPRRGVGMPTLLNMMSSRPNWSTATSSMADDIVFLRHVDADRQPPCHRPPRSD